MNVQEYNVDCDFLIIDLDIDTDIPESHVSDFNEIEGKCSKNKIQDFCVKVRLYMIVDLES